MNRNGIPLIVVGFIAMMLGIVVYLSISSVIEPQLANDLKALENVIFFKNVLTGLFEGSGFLLIIIDLFTRISGS